VLGAGVVDEREPTAINSDNGCVLGILVLGASLGARPTLGAARSHPNVVLVKLRVATHTQPIT